MLTIVTALPWEAAAFASRLRARRRTQFGHASGAWALRGTRGGLQLRLIVSGPGEDRALAAARALADLDPAATGILSTGVAGALDPALSPGTLVLATRIQHRRAGSGRRGLPIAATPHFRDWLHTSLTSADLTPASGDILSRDAILRSADGKADALKQTRSVAVQMEDYIWAEHAVEIGIPFASLRAILDPASAALPPEIEAWDPAGPSAAAVTSALLRRPTLAIALPKLAWQRRKAVRSIDRALEAIVAAGSPPPENAS